MATKQEKAIARKILQLYRDVERSMADPDALNVEIEELTLKLCRLCVGTKP